MKNFALVIVMFVSTGVSLAGGTPAVPPVKKDSGHAIAAAATKQPAPNHLAPSLPKPGLPVNAGRPRGTASLGGATGASGHKNGMLNGTEIKRHP